MLTRTHAHMHVRSFVRFFLYSVVCSFIRIYVKHWQAQRFDIDMNTVVVVGFFLLHWTKCWYFHYTSSSISFVYCLHCNEMIHIFYILTQAYIFLPFLYVFLYINWYIRKVIKNENETKMSWNMHTPMYQRWKRVFCNEYSFF